MKKYIYMLAIAAFGAFTACDYNEKNFDGLDDISKPSNVVQYDYTITDADITAIVNALKATKDDDKIAMAGYLEADKAFSDLAPAADCIPYLLKSKYTTVDKGSSANVTYNYVVSRTGELAALSTANYTLTDDDYKLVWGDDFVSALTPAKAPADEIPAILAAGFPDAVSGDYQVVDYNYSAEEPEADMTEVFYLNEGFESNPSGAGSGKPVDITGWVFSTDDTDYFWQCRTYSNNNYAQASGLNGKEEAAKMWMVTKQVDLTDATEPKFTFDVTIGYYTATCLSVKVSTNFDGTQAGIATATWADVTASFTLPTTPESGYGSQVNAGSMDLSSYAGQKIYIAFVYDGDDNADPKRTTTYQLDNVKVSEVKTAMTVKSTTKHFDAYTYNGTKWLPAANSIIVLQPADYTAMGVNYIGTSVAANYIPGFLASMFPYAQEGDARTVVFKSSNTANYADVYTFTDGGWASSAVETLTSQFVFSGYDQSGWVFDPTITYTMVKGGNAGDDYMLLVQYVIDNYESGNPDLIDKYRNSEYYYGFSGYYGNISLGSSYRQNDTTFAALTTDAEKQAYFKERTLDGLALFLQFKYPNATPQVSGIDVYAIVTCAIYDGAATDLGCTFKFKCVGANPSKWEFVEQLAGTKYWDKE